MLDPSGSRTYTDQPNKNLNHVVVATADGLVESYLKTSWRIDPENIDANIQLKCICDTSIEALIKKY
jgi:hypothetical protein